MKPDSPANPEVRAWPQTGGAVNASSRGCDRSAPPGFTLVELMIVMGIMALVLAMGMPSIVQTLKKEPLRQTVSDLVEGLSHARAQAILQGVPAEFILRAADGSISIAPVEDSDMTHQLLSAEGEGSSAPARQLAPDVRPFSAQMRPDIALALVEVNLKSMMEAAEVRVRFYPNGTSDEFTIVVQSPAGARKVSLDSITALADVEVIR
jgi:type II secretion system protein H